MDTHWNPLLYIGDIHLKAFMFFIQNQNSWGQQFRQYRDLGLTFPLELKVETSFLDDVLCEWNQILSSTLNKDLVLTRREQVYQEYENMAKTSTCLVFGYLAQ